MRFEGLAHRIARLAAFKPDKIDDDAAPMLRIVALAQSAAPHRDWWRAQRHRPSRIARAGIDVDQHGRAGQLDMHGAAAGSARRVGNAASIAASRSIGQLPSGITAILAHGNAVRTRHDRRIIRHEPIGHGRRPEGQCRRKPWRW